MAFVDIYSRLSHPKCTLKVEPPLQTFIISNNKIPGMSKCVVRSYMEDGAMVTFVLLRCERSAETTIKRKPI